MPLRRWGLVFVRSPRDDWRLGKIPCRWRRRGRPLQASSAPRIVARDAAIAERPYQVRHRNQVADAEDRGACRRKHVQRLELRRVCVVPARHTQVAEDELREERQIEPEKYDSGANLGEEFVVEPSAD